jgi:hypothetical protein
MDSTSHHPTIQGLPIYTSNLHALNSSPSQLIVRTRSSISSAGRQIHTSKWRCFPFSSRLETHYIKLFVPTFRSTSTSTTTYTVTIMQMTKRPGRKQIKGASHAVVMCAFLYAKHNESLFAQFFTPHKE